MPASALLLVGLVFLHGRPSLNAWHVVLAITVGIGTLLADLWPVQIAAHRRTSLGSVPTMIGLLLLPGGAAAAVAAAAALAATLLLRGPWYSALYGAGSVALAVSLASLVAMPPITAGTEDVLRAVAATLIYSAIAILLAKLAAILQREQPLGEGLMEAIRESWLQSLALDATAVAVVVLLVSSPYAALLPLGFLPLTYRMNRALAGQFRAKEQLATVLAAQRRFLTDVSHNVGNPLATILMNLSLLKTPSLTTPQQTSLRDARIEVNRLAELFRQLRVLAETDEEVPLHLDRVDLAEIAADVVRAYMAPARRRGVTLRLEAKGEIEVEADPDLIRHAAANLVENAIRYSPRDSTVRICVLGLRRLACLEVVDQGPGIEPERLPHIFNRFEHGPDGGSGLGLSIVHSVIERHGGDVEVASTPGETRFRILLAAGRG